jgi:hypothetical protein
MGGILVEWSAPFKQAGDRGLRRWPLIGDGVGS